MATHEAQLGRFFEGKDLRGFVGFPLEDQRRRLLGHQQSNGQHPQAQRIGPRDLAVRFTIRMRQTLPVQVRGELVS
jgi:hypothetical protein